MRCDFTEEPLPVKQSRRILFILPLITLLVVGCVRQAGQPFEPIAPSGNPTALSTDLPTSTPLAANAESANTEEVLPTETDETVTTAPPTETPLDLIVITDTPVPPTATATTVPTDPPATIPPTDTRAPASATPAQDALPATTEADETMPLGPSVPEIVTETPIPTNTPGVPLNPTPTSFLDEDSPETSTDDGETAALDNADEDGEDGCSYTVQSGDNPFRIAVNNNITLAELQSANPAIAGISPVIQPGQVLEIPGCGQGTAEEVEETEDPEESDAPVQPDTDDDATPTTPTPVVPEGFIRYEVETGDTLSAIAREYNTTIAELVEVNEIPNPDSLAVGDVLLIPESDEDE